MGQVLATWGGKLLSCTALGCVLTIVSTSLLELCCQGPCHDWGYHCFILFSTQLIVKWGAARNEDHTVHLTLWVLTTQPTLPHLQKRKQRCVRMRILNICDNSHSCVCKEVRKHELTPLDLWGKRTTHHEINSTILIWEAVRNKRIFWSSFLRSQFLNKQDLFYKLYQEI